MSARRPRPVRVLAMWSGPRNLSTAMMRSFEARGRTAVWDEPYYAYYLAETGLEHPGRDEIIAAGECDPLRLAERLAGPPVGGDGLVYQKHMTQHMVDALWRTPGALDWLTVVDHAFLVRSPAEVVASYARVRGVPTPEDVGFERQARLFEHITSLTGQAPPVVDAADIRARPAETLAALCDALGLEYRDSMLHWPPGPRASDGVWAPYWYHSVHASQGLVPEVSAQSEPLSDRNLAAVADAAEPYYQQLRALRVH